MSLPLPRLDDRTYADLMEELRARIPGLCPEWTDHNPSDPGITLLELFAWLTEMLLYRVNRVPDETVRTFLRLLNGPQWKSDKSLSEDIRDLVLDLRRPYRAVTAADYEALALEVEGVVRARCVPRRDLETRTAETDVRPGWVSLIVLPRPGKADKTDPTAPPLPLPDLLTQVREYLEPRRLLTVGHSIVGPLYAPLAVKVIFTRRQDADTEVQSRAAEAIRTFLSPYTGGSDGEGWPFGRDVYVSEIYQVLESVAGVDFVTGVTLSSQTDGTQSHFEAATEIRHELGDLVGLGLRGHLLPWAMQVTVELTA